MIYVIENSAQTIYIRAMKSWPRLTIVFLAYGIALLHMAVPHHHASAGNSNAIFFHASCLSHTSAGLLQRVLSTDLGYGHLENFKKSTDTDIRFSSRTILGYILLPALISEPVHPGIFSEFSSGFIEKLKKRLLLFSVSHRRAPPFFF
jgi:hypothetical protein